MGGVDVFWGVVVVVVVVIGGVGVAGTVTEVGVVVVGLFFPVCIHATIYSLF